MLTVLLVVGILVFLIVIHELGHFIAAKLFRVRVEEFGIGYPPRAFTLGKIGDTEYTLNWIPFGGFVRLFGDVGEAQHGTGSFVDARRGVQAAVLVAGVAMNALAAWGLFTAAYHVGIPRVVEEPTAGVVAHLIVANVVPGSPADVAGIAAGDEVLGLEDARREAVPQLTPAAFAEFVQENPGRQLFITFLHAGATTSAPVTPAHAVIPREEGKAALGVAIVLVSSQSLPWGNAAVEAFSATKGAFLSVVRGLGTIVGRALAGAPSLSDIVGPIGLVSVVGDAARTGLGEVFALAAFISVNLAIINLIPVPALDGGRLLVLGIEAAMRRSAPKLALQMLNALGVVLIIFLMITVTYQDITRLLS
ncbi:hypothetical protein A2853_02860 [Candidatus Kaiserbacteria bacterium RIFCSPHIGHO2_01_FULL_55_17]|uniref:Peptidase M50 domain-containing protein n=1 Tax=Candidatus Kaiserbacteria bacterium RIFCSPHIGHO2_01_FULL_55_17 TaxID=1798484 RepID=A0A1F6D9R6_9BACT|nr:MAG: hypothetical protein A2853_02860 [Candidatus Kaiserbacteria bacterium RIFCSPHIGHO2_01_FULL_55_17]